MLNPHVWRSICNVTILEHFILQYKCKCIKHDMSFKFLNNFSLIQFSPQLLWVILKRCTDMLFTKTVLLFLFKFNWNEISWQNLVEFHVMKCNTHLPSSMWFVTCEWMDSEWSYGCIFTIWHCECAKHSYQLPAMLLFYSLQHSPVHRMSGRLGC